MYHVHVSQTKSKKRFRRKKGESPFETQSNFKIDHEKKETSYTNPDAWGRLIGRINTSPIYLEGHLVTSLWIQALNCPWLVGLFVNSMVWKFKHYLNW